MSTWFCPTCGNTFTTPITLQRSPWCAGRQSAGIRDTPTSDGRQPGREIRHCGIDTAPHPPVDMVDLDVIAIPASEHGRHGSITWGMLQSRTARCPHCERNEPSIRFQDLAFFEYRGPGNGYQCDVCRVIRECHDGTDRRGEPLRPTSLPARMLAAHPPHEWIDVQGFPFDTYYCGCRGWD